MIDDAPRSLMKTGNYFQVRIRPPYMSPNAHLARETMSPHFLLHSWQYVSVVDNILYQWLTIFCISGWHTHFLSHSWQYFVSVVDNILYHWLADTVPFTQTTIFCISGWQCFVSVVDNVLYQWLTDAAGQIIHTYRDRVVEDYDLQQGILLNASSDLDLKSSWHVQYPSVFVSTKMHKPNCVAISPWCCLHPVAYLATPRLPCGRIHAGQTSSLWSEIRHSQHIYKTFQ